MNFPQINDVHFELNDRRLKVVMPAERNKAFLALYSVLLAIWFGASIWMLNLLFSTSLRNLPTTFAILWIIILIVWAYVWYRLGRSVWYWWQYYAATREVLFVDTDLLIVRRPLSLLGVTDGYDMQHVGPFYYSDKHDAIAFDYGSRGGLFGKSLPRTDAERLIGVLNRRFFPHAPPPESE